MAFSGWSTTAASNTNAATGVNFDENQAPSTVNDSAREMMAQLKAVVATTDTAQTIPGAKTFTGTTQYDASVIVGTNSTARDLKINGAAGQNRSLQWATAGLLRFWDILDTTAESGSDAGSNRRFLRYADNGTTQLGDWLQVRRSDGAVQAGNAPTGGFVGADIWNFAQPPRTSGVSFPATQVASADANTLDDYEEGTWTPSVGGTATYTTQEGTYTKIGRMVFIQCFLSINTIGSGSTTVISGLPFTAASTNGFTIPVSSFSNSATNVVFLSGLVNGAGTQISLKSLTAAAASIGTSAIFGNGTTILLSGSYNV